jgi:hypothetical protein
MQRRLTSLEDTPSSHQSGSVSLVNLRCISTIFFGDDDLHGRTVCVRADHIAATVASWLAELDAWSPFVELLGRAVRDGDWAAIHAIADYLSVEVQVAA